MKNLLFLSMICLVLFGQSCKSENKEATTEEKAPDTVVVASPGLVQPAPIDSAAVFAKYKEEHDRSLAATPKKEKVPAPKKIHSDPPIAVYEAGDDNVAGKKSTQEVYYYPSKWASFPGGEAKLNDYLSDNLKYPPAAQENGVEGTVYVDLTVDEVGNIVDATVISKHIGYGLEAEVLRVIKGMPKWNPGEYDNHTVKTKFTLPVVFDLK
jgi:protein TonB